MSVVQACQPSLTPRSVARSLFAVHRGRFSVSQPGHAACTEHAYRTPQRPSNAVTLHLVVPSRTYFLSFLSLSLPLLAPLRSRRGGHLVHPEGCILSRRQGKPSASAPKADRHGGDSGGPRAGKAALGNIRGEISFCVCLLLGLFSGRGKRSAASGVQGGSVELDFLRGSRNPRAPACALFRRIRMYLRLPRCRRTSGGLDL